VTTTGPVGPDRGQLGVHVDVRRSWDVCVLELLASGGAAQAEAHVQDDWPADLAAGEEPLKLVDPDQWRGIHRVPVS